MNQTHKDWVDSNRAITVENILNGWGEAKFEHKPEDLESTICIWVNIGEKPLEKGDKVYVHVNGELTPHTISSDPYPSKESDNAQPKSAGSTWCEYTDCGRVLTVAEVRFDSVDHMYSVFKPIGKEFCDNLLANQRELAAMLAKEN